MLTLLLLALLAGAAAAQEPSPALQLEAQKMAVHRARAQVVKCEDDLAGVWAQAAALHKEHQALMQEVEQLKRDYEALQKQQAAKQP
jgi:TolA-binding protein